MSIYADISDDASEDAQTDKHTHTNKHDRTEFKLVGTLQLKSGFTHILEAFRG